jgi:hypothetical protein
MESKLSTKGHLWSEHELEIAGQNYFYRCCSLCGRNFVRMAEEERWRAATIALARFTLIDDITDAAWSSEKCPGTSSNSQPV